MGNTIKPSSDTAIIANPRFSNIQSRYFDPSEDPEEVHDTIAQWMATKPDAILMSIQYVSLEDGGLFMTSAIVYYQTTV